MPASNEYELLGSDESRDDDQSYPPIRYRRRYIPRAWLRYTGAVCAGFALLFLFQLAARHVLSWPAVVDPRLRSDQRSQFELLREYPELLRQVRSMLLVSMSR